jgi:acetoin utilization deacetylase AcuC-like enzyme
MLAARVREYAPAPGRLVAFLEGGYDLEALRASASATASVLAGGHAATGDDERPTSGGPGREVVDRTRHALSV